MNIDCDMYVNNPKITLHAMCILLDPKGEKEVAFAQCPQQFYDGLKDDPFGNQMAAFLLVGNKYIVQKTFVARKLGINIFANHTKNE